MLNFRVDQKSTKPRKEAKKEIVVCHEAACWLEELHSEGPEPKLELSAE